MATDTPTRVAVVGGGPGGYAAAFHAADLGMQVTLVDEEQDPGGVCLYRGCIPSKALLHVAAVIRESAHASQWGVRFAPPAVDLDRLRAFKNQVVGKLTGGLGVLSRQRHVDYVRGRAALTGPRSIRVARTDGTADELTFDAIILATGSRPTPLPGVTIESDRLLDSTSALDLPDVPGRLLVVGGGYIGLELGTVYAALGSKVSVVEMTDGLLPGADRDLVSVLAKRVSAIAEKVMLETRVVGVSDAGTGLRVMFEAKDGARTEQVYDRVLVAIGRRPNSSIEGLDRTGVEIDRRGFITVDAQRRTAEPTIYAIGDVAGEPMLAHKAAHEARVAVEAIAGHKVAFEPAAIPAVVFTDPELAWCGLTEAQAKAAGQPVDVAKFPWGASGRAVTLDRPDGLTKLVLEPKTGRILGVGIVGPGAGELIAEGTLAIEMGANAADLKLTIHPHPTLSETVMESAEVFFGQSTHLHRPKREHA
ncbi:MAG: dihydrolipoyl dehydrogenase [Vicinamibacterales bacterium]